MRDGLRHSGNNGVISVIPINRVKTFASQLIEHGEIRRSWLGVYVEKIWDSVNVTVNNAQEENRFVNTSLSIVLNPANTPYSIECGTLQSKASMRVECITACEFCPETSYGMDMAIYNLNT